jgi:hypothetical protein
MLINVRHFDHTVTTSVFSKETNNIFTLISSCTMGQISSASLTRRGRGGCCRWPLFRRYHHRLIIATSTTSMLQLLMLGHLMLQEGGIQVVMAKICVRRVVNIRTSGEGALLLMGVMHHCRSH